MHHTIIQVLDSFIRHDQLRDRKERKMGVCFGIALSSSIAQFAGNHKVFEQTLLCINERFKNLFDHEIKELLDELDLLVYKDNKTESEKKIVQEHFDCKALLTSILLTQNADRIPPDILEIEPSDGQNGNVKKVSDFFLLHSKNKKDNAMIPLDGFCFLYTEADLKNFLSELDRNENVTASVCSFLVSSYDHAVSFTFNPDEKSWVFADGNFPSAYHWNQDPAQIASHAWKTLAKDDRDQCVFHVQAIASKENQTALLAVIDQMIMKRRAIITDLLPLQLLTLIASGLSHKDLPLLDDILEIKKIPSHLVFFSQHIEYIYQRKLTLFDKIIDSWYELGSVLMYSSSNEELNEFNSTGDTPLHFALKNNWLSVAGFLSQFPRVNIHVRDADGRLPIYYAVMNSLPSIINALLLRYFEDNNLQTLLDEDFGDRSLLHYLIHFNLHERAEELIEVSADINAVDHVGRTPLHLAIMSQNQDTIHLLLQYNNINYLIKSNAGKDAFDYADQTGNHKIKSMVAHAFLRKKLRVTLQERTINPAQNNYIDQVKMLFSNSSSSSNSGLYYSFSFFDSISRDILLMCEKTSKKEDMIVFLKQKLKEVSIDTNRGRQLRTLEYGANHTVAAICIAIELLEGCRNAPCSQKLLDPRPNKIMKRG